MYIYIYIYIYIHIYAHARAVISSEEEIQAVAASIEKTKAEFVNVEAAALEVMAAYKRTQDLQEAKQKNLKAIEDKFEAVRKDAAKLRAGQVDLENEVQVRLCVCVMCMCMYVG
jgi:septal ring factor EnvC (AmiA/AmiB activator)